MLGNQLFVGTIALPFVNYCATIASLPVTPFTLTPNTPPIKNLGGWEEPSSHIMGIGPVSGKTCDEEPSGPFPVLLFLGVFVSLVFLSLGMSLVSLSVFCFFSRSFKGFKGLQGEETPGYFLRFSLVSSKDQGKEGQRWSIQSLGRRFGYFSVSSSVCWENRMGSFWKRVFQTTDLSSNPTSQ